FCFTLFVEERELHSFPTRRSSDLLGFAMRILGFDVLVSIKWGDKQIDSSKDTWDGVLLKQKAGVTKRQSLLEQGYTAAEVEAWGDRKSTRLNSSHVKISYAVFCLK